MFLEVAPKTNGWNWTFTDFRVVPGQLVRALAICGVLPLVIEPVFSETDGLHEQDGEYENAPLGALDTDPFDEEGNIREEVRESLPHLDLANPLEPLPENGMINYVEKSWNLPDEADVAAAESYSFFIHGSRFDYTLTVLEEGHVPDPAFLYNSTVLSMSNRLRSFYIAIAIVGEEQGVYSKETGDVFRDNLNNFLSSGFSGYPSEAFYLYEDGDELGEIDHAYVSLIQGAGAATLARKDFERPPPEEFLVPVRGSNNPFLQDDAEPTIPMPERSRPDEVRVNSEQGLNNAGETAY